MAAKAQFDLERFFQALGDKTRLRLLNLMGDKEICVCYLVEILGSPQPKISRHLAYLRKAHLVTARKEGLWMHYKLADAQNDFHAKLLECLPCRFGDVPELARDARRLKKTCCADDSCCD